MMIAVVTGGLCYPKEKRTFASQTRFSASPNHTQPQTPAADNSQASPQAHRRPRPHPRRSSPSSTQLSFPFPTRRRRPRTRRNSSFLATPRRDWTRFRSLQIGGTMSGQP
ncbi:hypothetical protein Droror1_Dr00025090 [Drosera rotundifolia]